MQHQDEFLALVNDAKTRIREIDVQQLKDWILQNKSFQLLDVREIDEYESGAIPGAKHLSKGIIERDIETQLPDKSQTLVLYCGGGFRSALAADSVQKMGYGDVYSLAGGYRTWLAESLS